MEEEIIRVEERQEETGVPAVALRGLTVLPDMMIHFDLSRKVSINAVEKAMTGNQKVFLVTQKDPNVNEPNQEDVYEIGTVAVVKQITKMPGNIVRVLVDGLEKAKLLSFEEENTEYLSTELKKRCKQPTSLPLPSTVFGQEPQESRINQRSLISSLLIRLIRLLSKSK